MTRKLGLLATIAVLSGAAGCASSAPRSEQTVNVQPIHDELPRIVVDEDRPTSVRAGVMAMGPRPIRYPIVPKFEPIPLTEEEKAALGEQEKEEEFDLLAFYRPRVSAEQGILPIENRPDAHYFLPRRLISGTIPGGGVSGVFLETGGQYGSGPFSRTTALRYPEAPIPARRFSEGSTTIGVAGVKATGNRAHAVDY